MLLKADVARARGLTLSGEDPGPFIGCQVSRLLVPRPGPGPHGVLKGEVPSPQFFIKPLVKIPHFLLHRPSRSAFTGERVEFSLMFQKNVFFHVLSVPPFLISQYEKMQRLRRHRQPTTKNWALSFG